MNSICFRNPSAIKGVRDEGQERSDGSYITRQNGPTGPPKLGVQTKKKPTMYHNQRLFLINKAEVLLPVPTGEEGLPIADSH